MEDGGGGAGGGGSLEEGQQMEVHPRVLGVARSGCFEMPGRRRKPQGKVGVACPSSGVRVAWAGGAAGRTVWPREHLEAAVGLAWAALPPT